jgi:hypothetical protein
MKEQSIGMQRGKSRALLLLRAAFGPGDGRVVDETVVPEVEELKGVLGA